MYSRLFLLTFAVLSALTTQPAAAGAPAPTYWKDIRPIFRKYCTACHSSKNIREVDVSGGLALDSFEAARKGTTHPVIKPGKAEDSRLVRLLITTNVRRRMPLDAPPLPADKIALVRRWIDTGAKEGTKPEAAPDAVATRKPGPRRKLDVTLPTSAVPPADVLGKGSAGKLELALKVGPLAPVAPRSSRSRC
jgi:hypothetical protein